MIPRLAALLVLSSAGCGTRAPATVTETETDLHEPLPELVVERPRPAAEPTSGALVLATARDMVESGVVVRGACWDFVNAVFDRAGFPRGGARKTVFKGHKRRGPYAPTHLIEPGDWLYFINHSYRGVPHSAVFVEWEDEAAQLARTITYRGARKREPGRYATYELSSVYRVVRPHAPDAP